MKFAQKQNIFVCDYVITIKICQGQFYFHYSNRAMNYVFNVFKEYLGLFDYNHNTICIWSAR
jgi:hypothetical protein